MFVVNIDVHHISLKLLYASDYQKKIGLSKKKADEEISEVAADMELDLLQTELEEELDRELFFRDQFR